MQTDPVILHTAMSLALAAAGADAPPAGPALHPLKLCYVSVESEPGMFTTENVMVSGYGFRPDSSVNIAVDGVVVRGALADSDGELAPHPVSAPVQHQGQRPFRVRARDPEVRGYVAKQRALVSALAVKIRPRRARPDQRVRFIGRGFTDRGAIFAHYLRRGRLIKTVRLTTAPSGKCGTFKAHRRQFPFRPRQGTYLVQIDQHRRLTDDGPLVKLTIDVRRRPALP
jgi:hypothetical protein